jgi:hypothetical protein
VQLLSWRQRLLHDLMRQQEWFDPHPPHQPTESARQVPVDEHGTPVCAVAGNVWNVVRAIDDPDPTFHPRVQDYQCGLPFPLSHLPWHSRYFDRCNPLNRDSPKSPKRLAKVALSSYRLGGSPLGTALRRLRLLWSAQSADP